MARLTFDKLQSQLMDPKWIEEIEAQALIAKSKPMKDSPQAALICPRCKSHVNIIADGHVCGNCLYPLVFSPYSFENLPLVEFVLPPDLSHEKVLACDTVQRVAGDRHWRSEGQDELEEEDGQDVGLQHRAGQGEAR
jgi:hypothetical protein